MSPKAVQPPQDPDARLRARARHAVSRQLSREPGPLRLQAIVLAATGALMPDETGGGAPACDLPEIVRKMERAIARERGRARSGHRSYDVNRHIAMHQALTALRRMARAEAPGAGR